MLELTPEERTHPPHRDWPLAVVLAQYQLHEEERKGSEHCDEEVRQQKCTWTTRETSILDNKDVCHSIYIIVLYLIFLYPEFP